MILATGLTRAINHRMIDAFQMRHRCRFFGIGLTALLHQSGKRLKRRQA